MANEDDDIALSLPQPPPPAPARREATIEEAMRRFDAGGEGAGVAPSRPKPRRTGIRLGAIDRPQLGLLVAAALVAVIGLPMAWITATQETAPPTELASREPAGAKSFDAAPPAPADVAAALTPAKPAVVSEPSPPPVDFAEQKAEAPAAEAAADPGQAFAESSALASRAPAAREEERADRSPEDRLVMGRVSGALAARSAPIAVAPPPPPPVVMEQAPAARKPSQDRAADDLSDVVVTATKRRARSIPARGDWNACTINDPKRSLIACRSLLNPGAKGIKGQAAAHLADGLSLAWQGEMDRAITVFDQAIAIAPKSSFAYLNRGLAYQQQGDSDRALSDLDQAVRLAPDSARGYYNRSLLLRERGESRRARADQARAAGLDIDYQALID